MELDALRSREGLTILGAAVIDDVMGIVLLSSWWRSPGTAGGIGLRRARLASSLRMAVFFGGAVLAGRFLLGARAWADGLGVSQGLLAFVLAVALLYAWAAEYVGGVAAITGSYLAGVLFAQTPFKSAIDHGIHPLTYSMLVPVFFISIGLLANGRELGIQAAFTVSLVAVAIVTKAVGCAVFARLFGFTTKESVRVGRRHDLARRGRPDRRGLRPRQRADRDLDVFSASVIVVLATTMVTPPLLRLVFPRGVVPAHAALEETVGSAPKGTEAVSPSIRHAEGGGLSTVFHSRAMQSSASRRRRA